MKKVFLFFVLFFLPIFFVKATAPAPCGANSGMCFCSGGGFGCIPDTPPQNQSACAKLCEKKGEKAGYSYLVLPTKTPNSTASNEAKNKVYEAVPLYLKANLEVQKAEAKLKEASENLGKFSVASSGDLLPITVNGKTKTSNKEEALKAVDEAKYQLSVVNLKARKMNDWVLAAEELMKNPTDQAAIKKEADATTAAKGSTASSARINVKPECKLDGTSEGIWANLKKCHQCGGCELEDFLTIGIEIAKLILGLVGSLAFLMFVYGGFMLLISAGSPERIKTGQKIIVNAVIGLIIVLTSWLIIKFSYNLLGVEFTGTFDPKNPLPKALETPTAKKK